MCTCRCVMEFDEPPYSRIVQRKKVILIKLVLLGESYLLFVNTCSMLCTCFQFPIFMVCFGCTSRLVGPRVSCWLWPPCIMGSLPSGGAATASPSLGEFALSCFLMGH